MGNDIKASNVVEENTPVELPRLGNRREILVIAVTMMLVAAIAFIAGYFAANRQSASQPHGPEAFRPFWEVWNHIEDEFYYDVPSVEDRTYGAIRGLLTVLDDPYTAFVPPSIATIQRQDIEGEFGGIGAYVNINTFGQLVIDYPFPDSPAFEAGLLSGDVILKADGHTLEGLSLTDATALVRGPLGTSVMLEVYRPNTDETFEVSVERVTVQVPTVYGDMLDDNVAYVALYRFNGVATEQLEGVISGLLQEEPRALIFDLRGNPGGLLDEAVSVSDLFLPEGLVATQRTSLLQEPRLFYGETGDVAEDIPLIVLVDGGSASASEIVAGAIKDRERGVLVGTTSFGKGSVQLVHDLSDGSQLRITYGAWYTPEEIELNGIGIEPDIEVILPEDSVTFVTDPWLETAFAYIDEVYPQENQE